MAPEDLVVTVSTRLAATAAKGGTATVPKGQINAQRARVTEYRHV